jgi:hypothetical protein
LISLVKSLSFPVQKMYYRCLSEGVKSLSGTWWVQLQAMCKSLSLHGPQGQYMEPMVFTFLDPVTTPPTGSVRVYGIEHVICLFTHHSQENGNVMKCNVRIPILLLFSLSVCYTDAITVVLWISKVNVEPVTRQKRMSFFRVE